MGITIQDVLNLDVSKLSEKQIAFYRNFAQGQANRSLTLWKKREEKSQAALAVLRERDRFNINLKSPLSEQRRELRAVQKFLKSKTRTLAGWEKQKKQVIQMVGGKTGVWLPDELYSDFWKLWNRLVEVDPGLEVLGYKYDVMAEVELSLMETHDIKKSFDYMSQRLQEIYEEREKLYEESTRSISDFFK